MSKIRSRRGALLALALGVGLLLGAGRAPAGELLDLGAVEDFKARFNRDAGKPRLLLLLSPT